MIIEKDERKWKIVAIKDNEDCPFLTYPAYYHACSHPLVDRPRETACNMDICPLITKSSQDKVL